MAKKIETWWANGMAPFSPTNFGSTASLPKIVPGPIHGKAGNFVRCETPNAPGNTDIMRSEIESASSTWFNRFDTMVTVSEFCYAPGFPFGANGTNEFQNNQQWKDVAGTQSTTPPMNMQCAKNSLYMRSSYRGAGTIQEKTILTGPQAGVWYTLAQEAYLDGPNNGWLRVLRYVNGAWVELLPKWFPVNGMFYVDGGQGKTRFQLGIYHRALIGAAVRYLGYTAAGVGVNSLRDDFGITVGGTFNPADPTGTSGGTTGGGTGGGTTPAPTPGLPVMPTGILALQGVQATGDPQVAVSCNAVAGLIAGDGYQVYRDGTMIAGNPPLPSPQYVDADPALDWGQTRVYRMSAGQSGRYGPWTEPAATVTLVAPVDTTSPAAPGRPTVTAVSATAVSVSWPAGAETDIGSYVVERAVGAGAFSVLATLDAASVSYTDATVVSGTTYSYRIRAVDKAGNSSAPSQAVTATAIAQPGVPAGVSVSAPVPRLVSLSWTAVAGAPAYEVWRDGVRIAEGVPTNSYSDAVAPGDYVYQVAAGASPNVSALSVGVLGTAYGIVTLPDAIELPQGRVNGPNVTTTLSLTGRGQFTVTDTGPWLSASPTSGALSDTPAVITLTASPAGETAGAKTATLDIAEAPASGSSPPVSTTAPSITGTPAAGQTLTGADGLWSGSPTGFARKWYRDSGTAGAWVQVATTTTYALTAADVGFSIRFGVVATNGAGSSTEAFSATVGPVAAAATAPVNTGAPAISGSTQQGQALTGSMGTWTQSPTGYAWKWQRETAAASGVYADIAGASGTSSGTSASFTLTAGEVGLRVRLHVTATNAQGSTVATSAPTAAVTSGAPALTLARFALALNGSNQRVILAHATTQGVEPKTMGALVYLIPLSGRTTAPYTALGLPISATSAARRLQYQQSTDRAGWSDIAIGPRGVAGFPANKWVWLVATRDSAAQGRQRAIFCDMATGVFSALYDNVDTTWTFAASSAGNIIIGGHTETDVTVCWSGYWLAGFTANAFYTDAQLRALVSSQSGVFFIDPAVLLAAPSSEHVWRADAPASPIQDLKGASHETSRTNAPTVYDAGSAILPLKVS